MLYGDLLNDSVGTSAEPANKVGASEEVIFAGTESVVRELGENASTVHSLAKTEAEITASIALDRAGLESGQVNPMVVAQSLAHFDSNLALGLNTEVTVAGVESAESDPVAALEAGVEAKEGVVKKIIRKIKDFIKAQLLKLKSIAKNIANMTKLALINAKSLKDKADELEDTEKTALNKEDDLSTHDAFVKKLGFYLDTSKSIKANLLDIEAGVVAAYVEPTKTKVSGIVANIKSGSAHLKLDGFDGYVTATKAITEKLPATSGVRQLASRADIAGGSMFKQPTKVELVVLSISTGKDPKFEVHYEKETFKSDGVTYEKEITGSDIKACAEDLVSCFNKYDAKDVSKAVYDRLDMVNKEASEETKNMKSKYAGRVMKFVSFYNTLATKSIDVLVANQKAYYGAVKLLVNNAE